MSEQERNDLPVEPASEPWQPEDLPELEEVLAEKLSEAADSVTADLDDLKTAFVEDAPALAAEELPAAAPAAPQPAAALPLENSSDDRLLSGLAWLTMVVLQLPIVAIIQLLSPTNKERAFQKHHAVTSLLFYAAAVVYEIVAGIAYAILGLVTLGVGYLCLWPLFFVPHLLGLYYALQAYNGKRVELPILSDLGRNQGWM